MHTYIRVSLFYLSKLLIIAYDLIEQEGLGEMNAIHKEVQQISTSQETPTIWNSWNGTASDTCSSLHTTVLRLALSPLSWSVFSPAEKVCSLSFHADTHNYILENKFFSVAACLLWNVMLHFTMYRKPHCSFYFWKQSNNVEAYMCSMMHIYYTNKWTTRQVRNSSIHLVNCLYPSEICNDWNCYNDIVGQRLCFSLHDSSIQTDAMQMPILHYQFLIRAYVNLNVHQTGDIGS